MKKIKIHVLNLTENDVLIVGARVYSNLTISYSPGRVNVIGSNGLAESIPVTSSVWVKAR